MKILQFIYETPQADEELKNKRNTRRVGHPNQESNSSSEEILEYILLSEIQEGSSSTLQEIESIYAILDHVLKVRHFPDYTW